jgi:hypothetical protein
MIRDWIRRLKNLRHRLHAHEHWRAEADRWRASQEFPPGHYYSPIPSRDEVLAFSKKTNDRSCTEVAGVDLQWENQRQLFRAISQFYNNLPFGDTVEKRKSHRYYYENGFYSYTDGIVLSCLLQHLRPKRLIEVGSGFSSCLTLDTNELFLDNSLECTFIEPFPSRLKENIRENDIENVSIFETKVQDIEFDVFRKLERNDILFIDSSHVAKAGSDVNYLFFEVLPRLNSGVWIHIHDVFYPFEYPEEWILGGRSWNEAYLTRALLTFSESFRIRLWGDAMCARYPEFINSLMPKCLKNTGAGIWLEKIGRPA